MICYHRVSAVRTGIAMIRFDRSISLFLAAAALMVGLETSPVAGDMPHPRLDGDGMLIVAGTRRFVLGSYWNPGTTEGLTELREAGFNLVHSGASRASLDAIADQGLLAWIPLGAKIAPANDEEARRLETLVQPLLDHPALAVWEVPDEALWNAWYTRQQRLAKEREALSRMTRELEEAGKDGSQVQRLLREEARARARADWMAAEALDREIRQLLGAPTQNPDIQMSRAATAAEELRGRLLRGYRVLHRIDGRPVWMNYAPRNTLGDIQRYAEAADIVGCDIYPIPFHHSTGHSDLANRRPSSVGDYTDRFLRLDGNRPVWMVLQGFGWRDIQEQSKDAREEAGRRPTRRESRFMVYDAIVRGARGVLYWGINYAQEPPTFWNELKSVVHEVAVLHDVWAARDADLQPEPSFGPTMGSVDRPPRTLGKQLGEKYYVLVVNEHYDGLAVRLGGLIEGNGSAASIVGDQAGCKLEQSHVQNGKLSVQMPGYSAAILLLEP